MNKVIKVEKIVLNIKGKAIELSVDEAKQLWNELELAFGSIPNTVYVPLFQPCQPAHVIPIPTYPSQPQIWCGTTGGNVSTFGVSGTVHKSGQITQIT